VARNNPLLTRIFAIAASLVFAAFVAAKGIPTLRHDWGWPIERAAIPSFVNESMGGWLSVGLGALNPHPTTYLIALPIAATMWLFGPFVALGLLALATGYLCTSAARVLSSRWGYTAASAIGIGLFVLFNPWVYNQVVAGHLVMVLAYGGLIGLCAEMLRGKNASPVRLALWNALVMAQLQFFILSMLALAVFALVTKKWLPVLAGAVLALPLAIGLIAERATLLAIPYGLAWQTNQSVAPVALLGLGGYFAGYADRLGLAAVVAVWAILGLAIVGVIAARRSRAAICAASAAVVLYLVVQGVDGPLAGPYAQVVRNVPESGVFRELYDLVGVFAALVALLACAATGTVRNLGYLALCAGIALPITWLFRPPSDLWVSAGSYPHPAISAPPFSRVALMPAFQPLGLRTGAGDGADPNAYVYPGRIASLNVYLPAYPVDAALARYEQSGDIGMLRALGVAEIVPRPWLVSLSNGGIGLAARSLVLSRPRFSSSPPRGVDGPTPLVSECDSPHIVALANQLGACNLFFGDAMRGYQITPIEASSDSLNPQTAWIDARLAFAKAPDLAQAIGGALTQSSIPHRVEPRSWLLVYVHGRLSGSDGISLPIPQGRLTWLPIPPNVVSVSCAGLCELVAQASSLPHVPVDLPTGRTRALAFRELAPWLYIAQHDDDSARLLRLNVRYDPGWIAIAAWRVLPHVRVDMSVNGWFFAERSSNRVILMQVTAFLQLIAEVFGILCLLWLLEALVRAPTKRAP
jgi:hypothetical protein